MKANRKSGAAVSRARWLYIQLPSLCFTTVFILGFLESNSQAAPVIPTKHALAIIKDSKPVATIAIPDDADSWTKMAAGWIQEYMEKSSKGKLRIVSEGEAPEGVLISVGHTKLAERAGIRTSDLKFDGYRIVAKGNVVYMLGRDSKVSVEAQPGRQPEGYGVWSRENVSTQDSKKIRAKGTCKAAVAFLQKVCGVRWLAPTPTGEHISQAKDISVPGDLCIEVKEPAFAYFIGGQLYGTPLSSPAAFASNMLCPLNIRHYGGHSTPKMLPASKYFKAHPEYFALVHGERTGKGNHICTSNPEVRQILLKAIQADFNKGYDWVQFNYADGYKRCECEHCEAMDDYRGDLGYTGVGRVRNGEHPNERLLLTSKWLADELMKSHPDKTLLLLAYDTTILPSKKFAQFPDNVVIEVTRNGRPEFIEMWRGKTRGMTTYTCWFDPTLVPGIGVLMTPHEVSRHIRYYKETGVVGLFTWLGGGGFSWGLQGPTYYVLCQMVGDPTLDYKALVKEYCDGLYGEAADEMHRFFELLYTKSLMPLVGVVPNISTEVFKAAYSPRFVNDCDRLLRQAERAAKTARTKKWIRTTRDELDYARYLTNMIFLYEAYQATENPAVLEDWKKLLDEFNAYRHRVTAYEGEDVRLYFPGHGRLCKWLTSGINQGSVHGNWPHEKSISDWSRLNETGVGFLNASIGMPITLKYETLKHKVGLLVKHTAKPPTMDGVLDKEEWKGARPVSFSGVVATEGRAMYDNRNLYVVFQCEEPNVERLRANETYRDGAIWDMDCVELFLSPGRLASHRYYHFIVAPSKNALYDDRTGFKDPIFQDRRWNAPGFQYGYSIDQKGRRWTLEMAVPFKDLNVSPPSPGEVWRGNLARERYAGKGGRRQLSMWFGGGERFCLPENFGKFTFEKP